MAITNTDKLETLARHDGIEAAYGVSADKRETAFCGDDGWTALLEHATTLLDHTTERSVRLVVGKRCVLVQKHNDGCRSGVVYPSGHDVAKSVIRMVRRAAGDKVKNPKPTSKPAAVSPTATDHVDFPPASRMF